MQKHSGKFTAGPVAAMAAVVALSLAVPLAGCSADEDGRTVTVTHGEVPKPTLVDNDPPGASPGDVRIWHFDGRQVGGGEVRTDWTMTTTAVDAPREGEESRVATGVFTFATQRDQLILEGVAYYPGQGATVKTSSTVVRPIIGGSGVYAGATGWVASTHLDDGTWKHVFHIE